MMISAKAEATFSLPFQLHQRHALPRELEADLSVSVRGLELGLIGGRRESARVFEEADLIGGGLLRRAEGLPGDEGV